MGTEYGKEKHWRKYATNHSEPIDILVSLIWEKSIKYIKKALNVWFICSFLFLSLVKKLQSMSSSHQTIVMIHLNSRTEFKNASISYFFCIDLLNLKYDWILTRTFNNNNNYRQ